MLFNGNFAFLQFPMLFNGNMRLRSFGKEGDGRTDGWTDGRTDGQTDGRTDGCLEIHPCVLQDIGPLGPLPKKDQSTRATRQLFFGDKQSLLRFVRFLIVFVPWRKKFIPGQIVTNKFWFATHAINTATSIFFKISVPEVKIIPFIQSIISIQYW